MNKESTIERDGEGVIRRPNLHDAMLHGIVVTERDELWLLCRTEQGTRYQLDVPRVRYLRAENFRQGNIIFDVKLVSGPGVDRSTLEWLLYHDRPADQASVNALANDVERGDCTLVEVTTSYGCCLVAVAAVPASEVRVSERWCLADEGDPVR